MVNAEMLIYTADIVIAGKGHRPLKITFLRFYYATIIVFGQNRERERMITYYCVIRNKKFYIRAALK